MSTLTPPPGFPLDPPMSSRWQEPTRRHPFVGRFDYSGRYAASLVTLLFAVYLQINTSFSQLVQAVAFNAGFGADITLLFVGQFVFTIACFVVAFLIAPATMARRALAAGLAVVILVVWALLFAGRLTGDIRLPGNNPIGFILTNQAGAGLFAALLGWLIVRERPALSYLVLIPIVLIGIVGYATVFAGVSSGITIMVTTVLTVIIGVAAAWGARGLATLVQRGPVG
ncbi:hypothetical protein BH11ACT3_BH11ACT3_24030 [soil metagenome]